MQKSMKALSSDYVALHKYRGIIHLVTYPVKAKNNLFSHKRKLHLFDTTCPWQTYTR